MSVKFIFLLPFFLFSCGSEETTNEGVSIDKTGVNETVIQRIKAPAGYEWIVEKSGSFGEFLQNSALKKAGSPILDYANNPINNQYEHIAIMDYDVGNKDLQQCADAVIRLRAEYLFKQKRLAEIVFHFTNGDKFSWNDYRNGIRPQLISSSKIAFKNVAGKDNSYANFRKYLDVIFMYAGTISLNNETIRVTKNSQIKTGDFLVTPGSPGHAVIIVGRAKNKQGNVVFLLAEGYTPAQSIHILTNPYSDKLNPWYKLDVNQHPTTTARYSFTKTNIKTFEK